MPLKPTLPDPQDAAEAGRSHGANLSYSAFLAECQSKQLAGLRETRDRLIKLAKLQKRLDGPKDVVGGPPARYTHAALALGLKPLSADEITEWLHEIDEHEANVAVEYGDSPAARAAFEIRTGSVNFSAEAA